MILYQHLTVTIIDTIVMFAWWRDSSGQYSNGTWHDATIPHHSHRCWHLHSLPRMWRYSQKDRSPSQCPSHMRNDLHHTHHTTTCNLTCWHMGYCIIAHTSFSSWWCGAPPWIDRWCLIRTDGWWEHGTYDTAQPLIIDRCGTTFRIHWNVPFEYHTTTPSPDVVRLWIVLILST